jgi:rod shape determining protein RodA
MIVQLVRRSWHALTEHIDASLFTVAMILSLIGLASVYSASVDVPTRVNAQLINMTIAFAAMWIVARIPPQNMARVAVLIYVVGMILLLLVWLFGVKVNGARRWLDIGVGRIQPSEFMKLAVPLVLAWYLARVEDLPRFKHHLVATILLLLPVGLILKQPDLGTALLVAGAGFFVIFLSGLSMKLLAGIAVLGAAAAPFLWNHLHDYQRRRILTLFDPAADPLGAGYHTLQSTIAIGSGGWFGKGWLQGSQTHLEFIPEKHTDFIFAVYSEEWGLFGNLVLLAIYTVLIARGLMIAIEAPTRFARLLAGAVTLIFFTYAFVNMGMVSGILPVVGVPLPFISYGGTALLTLFVGIGILMSIQSHQLLVKK